MAAVRTLLRGLTVALTGACLMPANAAPPGGWAQARDFVLARCLIDRYAGTPLAQEAEAWVGGIVERGTLPVGAYARLSALVEKAPAPRTTPTGAVMRLANCVDFHNDPALQARIRQILAK